MRNLHMVYLCLLLAVGMASLAPAGCDARPVADSSAAQHKRQRTASTGNTTDDSVIECVVDVHKPTGIVHKKLFGTNVEWFNNANGIWREGAGLDNRLVELAANQGISLVRFPGGTFSDFYQWQDGIGPQASRPVRPHYTDPGSSRNVFGTAELVSFCNRIGAEPLLTVNVGTGTPASAAQWVSYANSEHHRQRAAHGHTKPFGVKLWEIGNELYLAGNEAEKKITQTPGDYAKKLIAYADQMKSVDPTISIMAIGVAGAYAIPFGPYRDWNEIILKEAHAKIDYLAVHNAYFPVLIDTTGLTPKSVYQALWGSAIAVDNDLSVLTRLISRYEKDRDIGIAVTEWGPFFSISDPVWVDHVKTLGSGVYIARIFQVLLSQPKVRAANFFKFTDTTFMGWVSYDGKPKVPYYVVQLYAKHFGDRLVHAHIGGPSFATQAIGLAKAQSQVPELTAIAAVDHLGKKLFVNIVSCSWDQPRNVVLKTRGFTPTKQDVIIRMINGASPVSHNGPDLPAWWPIPVIEPDGGSDTPPITIETMRWDRKSPFKVPPHSIVMMEME
jgi:alpha-N-arabinofuranosidase